MAAEQMKKVTSRLNCPICCELYKKPKYLQCHHSYCEECLGNLVVESNITCPECRKTSVVPSGGVAHLPNNFFINGLLDEIVLKCKVERVKETKCELCVRGDAVEVLCLDCGKFLCASCFDNHKYSKEYHNHKMMPLNELQSKKGRSIIRPSKFTLQCQEHKMELTFYCETCDQLICQYCIAVEHSTHDHGTVKEIATKHRKRLEKIMEPVEKMIEELSVACKNISNMRDKIGAQADDIDTAIDRYYEKLQQRLQQQREDLKKRLHEASKQKKKEVTLQLEQMEHTLAQLESIKELSGAMLNKSDQEALSMKKQADDDLKRISNSYYKIDAQPIQSASMEFYPVEEYKTSMPQFGHLSDGACPMNCEVELPRYLLEGFIGNFKVITRERSNRLYRKGGSEVVMQAQSSRGDVTPVAIKDNKDGTCSASFLAISNQVGEVKLSITVKGQQIKGSPFSINIRSKYNTIDKPSKVVNEGGKMGTLCGIAFGKDGMWAVTDITNHCVWIFDSGDQPVRKFGSNGNGNGKFSRPIDVAFDASNHLYVTDHYNYRVQKFDINGTYLFQFGNSHNAQLHHPAGIVVCNDKVYVAEFDDNIISAFRLDGQFSHTIGSGDLINPVFIAISNNDRLLVADRGHHCISIFTLDGNYVGKFGTRNTGRHLRGPAGIATDLYGFIFVAEEESNCVSLFDKDGVFIHSFGSKGSGHGRFSRPTGLAISPTGDIYISDMNNRRIQIFST